MTAPELQSGHGHFFGTTPQFWLNLQTFYELRLAEQRIGATIRALPTLTGRTKKTILAQPHPA